MELLNIPTIDIKSSIIKNIIEKIEKLYNEYKGTDFIPTNYLLDCLEKIQKTSTKMHKKYSNFSLTVNTEMLSLINFLVDVRHFSSKSELIRNVLLDYLPKQLEIQCFFELFNEIKSELIENNSKQKLKKTLENNSIIINGIKKLIIKQEKYENAKSNHKKD